MRNKNPRQKKSASETEELVSLAQNYFSHDFPNRGRNCPTPAELVKQIESGELPDDCLREHLLACSKCFVTFRERQQGSRKMQPEGGSLRRRISDLIRDPWVRVLAPSLPALLVALLGILYFSQKNSPEKGTLLSSPVNGVNSNTNALTIGPPSPVPTDPSNQGERALHVARVDLRNYSPQRGNEPGEESPPLRIEQKPTVFMIRLPDGSPRGTYSASIVDAFGKPIKTRTTYSADGKRLTATLDLHNLQNQTYRLCVSRADEPPICFPIAITNRGK